MYMFLLYADLYPVPYTACLYTSGGWWAEKSSDTKWLTYFWNTPQAVVEEIKAKNADLVKIQQSGHDLKEKISGT
jgi:hypothetical protein